MLVSCVTSYVVYCYSNEENCVGFTVFDLKLAEILAIDAMCLISLFRLLTIIFQVFMYYCAGHVVNLVDACQV